MNKTNENLNEEGILNSEFEFNQIKCHGKDM